jgi:predicted RNase H-like HicB family nuclease
MGWKAERSKHTQIRAHHLLEHEDQFFVAEVPELPGCMAHGSTQEAALAHANEAIQLWIDTAREFGDPIPEPKGERLMLA